MESYEAVVNLEKDIETSISFLLNETCSSSSSNLTWLDSRTLTTLLKEIKKITQTYNAVNSLQDISCYSLFIPNDVNKLDNIINVNESSVDSIFN